MPRKDSIDIGELTDSAFYILSSVIEEKHGYLIMKTIENLLIMKLLLVLHHFIQH